MSPEETFYHSYELQPTHGKSTSLEQPFVLRNVAGKQDQHQFDNFEQVMNFVLDKLLDKPGTKSNKGS